MSPNQTVGKGKTRKRTFQLLNLFPLQLAFTCLKSTMETPGQYVKSVQSKCVKY